MKDKALFWDKIADVYAARPISDRQTYEQKLAATRKLMRPDMHVLEFGSGTGGTAILLSPHVACYRACDLSPKMTEIARAKKGASRVEFEVADFDGLNLKAGALDMINAHSILHLAPNPAATIANTFAALKPGGFFISSTPCLGEMWYLKVLARIGQALGRFPPFNYFTVDQLTKMLTGAGFDIIESWPEKKNGAVFFIGQKPACTVDA